MYIPRGTPSIETGGRLMRLQGERVVDTNAPFVHHLQHTEDQSANTKHHQRKPKTTYGIVHGFLGGGGVFLLLKVDEAEATRGITVLVHDQVDSFQATKLPKQVFQVTLTSAEAQTKNAQHVRWLRSVLFRV